MKTEATENENNSLDFIHNAIVRSTRNIPPAHYMLRIHNSSLLLEAKVDKFESGVFESGGYKWVMSVYPNRKKKRNEEGHISLYLEIAETDRLPLGWEVHVNFKFFVFDQIHDTYLTLQDGSVKRFHKLKPQWGFDKLLSLNELNDPSKGYLVEDSCVFGVEVFVVRGPAQIDNFFMIKDPENGIFPWTINLETEDDQDHFQSDIFIVEGLKWRLHLHKTALGLSIYLILDESATLPSKCKVYVKFILRLKDQVGTNHIQYTVDDWFEKKGRGWGCDTFATWKHLHNNNTATNYLLNNDLVIETQFQVISVLKDNQFKFDGPSSLCNLM